MAHLGQTIIFAIEWSEDDKFGGWHKVEVKVGDTVRKLTKAHPEMIPAVLHRNGIRSATQNLRHRPKRKHDRKQISLPGRLRSKNIFEVLAGDEPPQIVKGYAKFSTLSRPERTGVATFDGYDPIELEIPLQFEGWINGDGAVIERRIKKLERMAGRGPFKGAADGPPPVVHVSAVDSSGKRNGLIPLSLQRYEGNPTGPLWRITGIRWENGALRDDKGQRLRAACTVTLTQHTAIAFKKRAA
jgi:hypothetical protein